MTAADDMAPEAGDPVQRAAALVSLFCPVAGEFGHWSATVPDAVPEVPRRLLDHRGHMTVTMEREHRCPLTLRVVAERTSPTDGRYSREILLVRPDGRVVQHGIVRIDLAALDASTADAIRSRSLPLGRILVDAGLLCDVQHVALLRFNPGPHLSQLFGGVADKTFGRVAAIDVGGRPAIELLEIVAPASAG
ncbi:MAG: hypothetical protein K8S94_05195 [Planctomycetia bacterium]|nr:hypothetical protein [Planctomycetia bacterium]